MAVSEHQQLRMIVWTGGIVLLLSAATAMSMLQPPTKEQLYATAPKTKKAPTLAVLETSQDSDDKTVSSGGTPAKSVLAPAGRSPASVSQIKSKDAINSEPDIALQQSVEFVLPCLSRKKGSKLKLAESIKQLRLTGKSCRSGQLMENATVSNLANGFSATVFAPTPVEFTTDYISLEPGPNTLHIVQIYKAGAKDERDLVIER